MHTRCPQLMGYTSVLIHWMYLRSTPAGYFVSGGDQTQYTPGVLFFAFNSITLPTAGLIWSMEVVLVATDLPASFWP